MKWKTHFFVTASLYFAAGIMVGTGNYWFASAETMCALAEAA